MALPTWSTRSGWSPCRLMSKAGSSPPLPRMPRRNGIGEPPVQSVAPLVINADVFAGIAGEFTPHQRAAMRTAVDKGVDGAGGVTVDDDRGLADIGCAKIAGVGNFGLEAEIVPHRALKDLALFLRVNLRVVVEPVRHSAVIKRRPNLVGYRHSRRLSYRSASFPPHPPSSPVAAPAYPNLGGDRHTRLRR